MLSRESGKGAIRKRTLWFAAFLFAFCAALAAMPEPALAHASLTDAEPAAGSVLDEPPDAVRLTFNERLESGLYAIRVFDGRGREVTKDKAVLSPDRREVSVALPRLADGTYTVSYRVLSADGHPVAASYVFHVGDPAAWADGRGTAGRSRTTETPGGPGAGGHAHRHAEGANGKSMLLHGVKAVYLIAMLLFAGLALWRVRPGLSWMRAATGRGSGCGSGVAADKAGSAGPEGYGTTETDRPSDAPGSDRLAFWQLTALRLFLLALIAWIGLQLPQLMDGWTADHWASLLKTSLGRLWAAHVVLALVGLAVSGAADRPATGLHGQERPRPGRPAAQERPGANQPGTNRPKPDPPKPDRPIPRLSAWPRFAPAAIALLMLAAKATSGHAAAAAPVWATVAFDAVHLLMAALWAGGLLILLVLRHGDRRRMAFLVAFARLAWISIAVLAASGFLMTWLMLPGFRYVLYSGWGTALLVKLAAVLLVLPVAGAIRWQMKRRGIPSGRLVAVDFGLAVAVIAIAAVLSGLNPVPANKPLHWHVMGEDIHMTAQISPNAPGSNRFMVKVWLPEDEGGPERVQLQLIPRFDGDEPAPIDVPLAPTEDLGERDFFPGFNRYDYAGEGIYLAFPGEWRVRVLVTAPDGQSYSFTHDMRVY